MSSRFNFRGSCVAVGATPDPRRPERPTVFGTVCLPIVGGVAQDEVGGGRIKSQGETLAKFKNAWTKSVGVRKGQQVTTRVDCRVTGLEVRDSMCRETVLRAEEIEATAESGRTLGESEEEGSEEQRCLVRVPEFTFTVRARRKKSDQKRTTFIIRVRTDGDLWKIDHLTGVEQALAHRKSPRKRGYVKYTPLSHGDIDCPTSPDIAIDGNVVAVRDFGRIHLAEVRRSLSACRFTLMRIELGNPLEFQDVSGYQESPPGEVVVIEPEVNGQEEDG